MKFVPPYDRDGNVTGLPAPVVFGLGSTQEKESANASAPTGRIRFFVKATAKATAGVVFTSATATGFLESCFEVQTSGKYTFNFDYDWSVLASVPGFVNLSSAVKTGMHATSGVAVKVFAEIFDKNGQLVADNQEITFRDFFIPIPFVNPDKAQGGARTLTILSVPLDKKSPPSPYRWRFSSTAIAMAWASGVVSSVSSICCTPGSPGAPKIAPAPPIKFTLKQVVVTPDVYPTPCP